MLELRYIAEQLEVSVTDTGPGIPADSRSGLFQKYFQASNNTDKQDSSKSTGLGLYVTKLIVEAMGGTIRLAPSAPGQGSAFAFTLPLTTTARLKLIEKQQGVHHEVVAQTA